MIQLLADGFYCQHVQSVHAVLGVAKKTLGLKFASGRPDRESTWYVHSKYTKTNKFLYIWIPAHRA